MKISSKGVVAILIATLELAFLPILLDVGGTSIGTIQLLVYTFIVGSAASLLLSYKMDRFKNLTKIIKSKNALIITAIAGILNYGIAQILLTMGTLGTNPSIASVVFRSWVLMLAILVPFTLRNKINIYQIIATAIGFVGVFILATGGTLISIQTSELPFIALLLGSALAAASSNLIIKRYNVNTVDAVVVFNVASLAFSFSLAILTGTVINFVIPGTVLIAILFLGIVTYTLGSILFYYSFKTLNTVLVANTSLIIPFLTILLSFLLLGTPIEPYYIYAYALIALGIILQQRYSTKAPEYIVSKKRSSNLQIFDVTGAFINNKTDVIYKSVAQGKRALAIKTSNNKFNQVDHASLFNKYDCVAFTDKEPHPAVQKDELEFIDEIVGITPNEDLLICLGNSDNIEAALEEFTSD